MTLARGIDGPDPRGAGPAARHGGVEEERRSTRSNRLGMGTLACPRCDAPVALAARRLGPADPLECPFCRHSAPLRDFLSLSGPSRPARVEVRVLGAGVRARRPPA